MLTTSRLLKEMRTSDGLSDSGAGRERGCSTSVGLDGTSSYSTSGLSGSAGVYRSVVDKSG